MRFEWDPKKAAINKRKHGVTFDEAVTCFADPLALVLDEAGHPERLVLIGASTRDRVLFTVFAELIDDHVRIVSARFATRHERSRYEEGTE
ncbi:MAG: BrnT family toxin [Deltaproteobacteria bacterium]|nr:BrnT family toxin [Deltaproteobacteria bacterium]